MDNAQMFYALLTIGLLCHLFLRRSYDIGQKLRSLFCNQIGEGETGGEVKFTPEQQTAIDKIINSRVGEIKGKYDGMTKEYEQLKQFKTEYEKSQEQRSQEELVKAKKYEEAEGTYKKQIGELSGKLTAKDQEIQNIKIDHSLSIEIGKQNGFTEETLAMIRSSAIVDANGQVLIKTKDANGVDQTVPVADGVKKFLTERPHLVRSSHSNGSGSGAGGKDGSGSGGEQGEDLASLNAQLATAMKSRPDGANLKLRAELRGKIQAAMAAKGVNR